MVVEPWATSAAGRAGLVTLDLDFSNILSYPPQESAGFVVLRTARQDAELVMSLVRSLLPRIDQEELQASLWIIEHNGIRVWRR